MLLPKLKKSSKYNITKLKHFKNLKQKQSTVYLLFTLVFLALILLSFLLIAGFDVVLVVLHFATADGVVVAVVIIVVVVSVISPDRALAAILI